MRGVRGAGGGDRAAAQRRAQSVSRWRQPGRFAPTHAAAVAPVHAGRLHRVRHPRAGQRVVPHPLPPGGDAHRRHRTGERHARRQRRHRHRGLRPADRQADAVHLRSRSEGPRDARHPREVADPRSRRRHRPRADLQDLQGPAHLQDERRRHRLGAEPERLSPGRAAAQRVRVPVVERRGADVHHQRRPTEAGVREPERPEQPGHHPRAPHRRPRSRRRSPPTCSSTM